ncbi:MAG TPA: flagellar hook capping FlgD N-terminal domain-containing protein [Lysobacter sp.]|nr:flagellar hook capping FlgD N-terminal domain-containing protein [Lysobacter sp.]
MTSITGTGNDNPYGALGLAPQADQRSTSLGQADFLRLMTEQLKNQDPLKPLDNNQFLGQLAQFSTVQGIDNMQSAMGSMASVMESDQTLRAASLVGREALVAADKVDLAAGAGTHGEIVATTAGTIQIEIVDSAGAIVRKTSVEAGAAGNVPWQWDGRNDDGEPIAAGTYSIKATSGTGKDAETLDLRLSAKVDSVSIEPTGLVLNLSGLGSHPLSSIRRVG